MSSSNQRPIMGPPETPSRAMQPSSSLFPTLQLSPDLYAHQFSGPTTAQVYPNQGLLWDSSNLNFHEPSLSQQYQDPFQFNPSALSNPFASSTVGPSFTPQGAILDDRPYDLPAMPRSSSFSHIDGAAFPAPFTTSPRMPLPQVENPSMFLSSPARRFGPSDRRTSRSQHNPVLERPAYAHQMEESRREQEMKRLRGGDTKQPSITRSVMEALRRPVSPKKDSRPGLKRSLTHTGVRGDRGPKLQTHGPVGGRNSPAPVEPQRPNRPGRSSPLKSNADPVSRTLTSSRNANPKRGSLSLAIDENGVAKTIMAENDYDMDLGGASGSDAESFDDTDFHILRSQKISFAFLNDEDLSRQSHARMNRPYSHSKTSSHSTMASVNSNKQSSYQSSASSLTNTRGSDGHHARRKRPILGSTIEDDTLMEDEPAGNAQYALRAIIQDRSRSTSTPGDHSNPAQWHSSPPLQQSQYAVYNASPTTITDPDLATPSTDRESLASNTSTRLIHAQSGCTDLAWAWTIGVGQRLTSVRIARRHLYPLDKVLYARQLYRPRRAHWHINQNDITEKHE
ncbi:uncharacterized protein Z518_02392 [Rhinocladiella mackenziei CBS 650.93]|uniref:Uncharacterized protein n=1 Tax=Rhinocladiella mackenziei CBS 650.93 TaxID=1442369 RepID=A0A0D2HBC0_9EURO|nr:uncharacterized protein Z518_02392 [Rhinocladiella mackenziei CBS 650.93]KIX07738.1 hypothetical protein Z518_02392 [Rhinocladiella mackenziei CBS 650.93]